MWGFEVFYFTFNPFIVYFKFINNGIKKDTNKTQLNDLEPSSLNQKINTIMLLKGISNAQL